MKVLISGNSGANLALSALAASHDETFLGDSKKQRKAKKKQQREMLRRQRRLAKINKDNKQ
jgi:hypothetical protein